MLLTTGWRPRDGRRCPSSVPVSAPAATSAESCDLPGDARARPSNADCFAAFSRRLHSFFHGEHPTRVTWYSHSDALASVQPARTVYAGNYVFRPAALQYFIPFAALRLRMSGPTLGRILKAELGPRFISANLPMLHKRTVESGGQSEFRPGIETVQQTIDMSGEFERQFYGDVMLFSVEQLAAENALCRPAGADFASTLDSLRDTMLARYNERQQAILEKLGRLETLLNEPARWWQAQPETVAGFRHFAANVRRNFGDDSLGHRRINDPAAWQQWRTRLLDGIAHYAEDRAAWVRLL